MKRAHWEEELERIAREAAAIMEAVPGKEESRSQRTREFADRIEVIRKEIRDDAEDMEDRLEDTVIDDTPNAVEDTEGGFDDTE